MNLLDMLVCAFVTCNVLFFAMLFVKERFELPQHYPDYPADEQPRLS
ncbi:hypothetical protein [Marininema mesophilum]|nr:hypothetical protein [Marininema mesophilum]